MRKRLVRARALIRAAIAVSILAGLYVAVLETTLTSSGVAPLGRYVWTPDVPVPGGYSALHLDADGKNFTTLSDQGRWIVGTLSRDATGVVTGVQILDHGDLRRSNGSALWGGEGDAEGIARLNGAFYVSFEGADRVMRYDTLDAAPTWIAQSEAFGLLAANRGLEALAVDRQGRLLVVPERALEKGRLGYWPLPIWRFDKGAWRTAATREPPVMYRVTGADVGPDGALYLLERAFLGYGFRSRLRRLDLADGGADEVIFESAVGDHDNLEGLSIWRDDKGRLRATMISDDNLFWLQRTEIVDYILD